MKKIWQIDFRHLSYCGFWHRICHGAFVLYPISLICSSTLSHLIFWKVTLDTGAGRNHWNSNLLCALLQRSLWISDNLPAEPGLCLSWQPRCLHGLSRGPLEVRVQRRSRFRVGKTKASTSCVTHWLILHSEREWTYGTLEFGLRSTCLGLHDKSQKQERK